MVGNQSYLNSKRTMAAADIPKVNDLRLWNDLQGTALVYGGTRKGGVNRATLTDTDKKVRDWFVEQAKNIDDGKAKVYWDEMGNIFAVRAGKNNSLPPIAIGSHLDTQFTGGWYG